MADASIMASRQDSNPSNEIPIRSKITAEQAGDKGGLGDKASESPSLEFGLHFDNAPLMDSFVDRPLLIEELKNKLCSPKGIGKKRVLLIHGEPGVGKTQLSLDFAKKNKESFSSVFWLDGSTEESLKWDIATLQHHLKGHTFSPEARSYARSSTSLTCAVKEVLQWFSITENCRWLLIVDNVMSEYNSSNQRTGSFNLELYLPTADHGCILITSHKAQTIEGASKLELGMLEIDQAELLLEQLIGMQLTELGTPDEVNRLLELLGRSPIAITQAGTFIKKTNIRISVYLDRYQNTLARLKKSSPVMENPRETNPSNVVSVPTAMTYDHICSEDETAANFLKLWTYLDHRDLWYELFTPDFPLPVQSESLWWFRLAIQTSEGFTTAMKTLQDYGMVQTKENSSGFFLHPLILECARQVAIRENDPEFPWLAVRTVGRATPSSLVEDKICLRQRLRFHTNCCYFLVMDDTAVPYFTLKNPFLPQGVKLDTALVYFSAVYRLGKFYVDTGIRSRANELYLRVSKEYAEILGAESDITLEIVSGRAALLVADGKMDEAEGLFVQVHRAHETSRGSSDPLTWTAAKNLAVIQLKLGKLSLAESSLRRVLDSDEAIATPDHPRVLGVIETLGTVYSLQNRYEESAECFLRVLPFQKSQLGPSYFELLKSMLLLAVACMCADKFVEAEKMALACLQEYEQNSKSEVSVTLGLIVAIGEECQKQGQTDRAENMFLKAVEGYERCPGGQEKVLADTAYNLANFYTFQGRIEDAEKMVLKSIQGYNTALGADHHYTLDALNNLANIQARLGRNSEAEQTYLQVLQSKDKNLGPNHHKTLETINNLGTFYASQDNFIEAEKMYLRALDGFKTVLGPDHSITLGVFINMGSLYISPQRRHEAVKVYILALDGYERVLLRLQNPGQGPESNPAMAGSAAASQVMYAQYSGAGDEEISAFIPGITTALSQLDKLARLQVEVMEWVDAEDVYLRLLRGKELFMGIDNPMTRNTLLALAKVLFYRCMFDSAAEQGADAPRLVPSQINIGGWAEPSPIWRLAFLAETYKDSSAELIGTLGKTLLPFGDEQNALTALRFELAIINASVDAQYRACDRCLTSITPNTGWFVCKSCFEDTDLCESCHNSRNDGQWQEHSCLDHVFQAVVSADLPWSEASTAGVDPTSWLVSLKAQYETGEQEEEELEMEAEAQMEEREIASRK